MPGNHVIFLSFYDRNYSRSAVLLNAKDSDFERFFYQVNNNVFAILFEFLRILRFHRGEVKSIIVMSPCHKIVPVIRFICRYPIILDAGWPLTDGLNSRRSALTQLSFLDWVSSLKILAIDHLAFRLSNLVLLETSSQLRRVNTTFRITKSKLKVSFTGFNEVVMGSTGINLNVSIPRINNQETVQTRVLFRGKINNESGYEIIVEAFKYLDDSFEILYVLDRMPDSYKPSPREKVLIGFTESELPLIYRDIDICIGQVSSHPRLDLTIPHKAFEAAYFGKAFISAKSIGIREFASPSEAIYLDDITPISLSNAICDLAQNKSKLAGFGRNFQQKYFLVASQQFLGIQLDNWIREVIEKPLKNPKHRRFDQ